LRRSDPGLATAILAILGVMGCLGPFPPAVPLDLDGDGVTLDEGDCNDADPDIHPDVDECALVLAESLDHDCDGFRDGGTLPVVDEFDDGLLYGWVRPSHTSPVIVREHSGVVEQLASGQLMIVKEDGAECWQDLDVTAHLRPGLAGELICYFYLRTRGMGTHEGLVPRSGYGVFLHHHSQDMDGANDTHWDGWVYPHMGRVEDSWHITESLVGSGEENYSPYPGDEHFIEASDEYWVNVSVRETGGGTELTCRYATEDPMTGGTYRSCFPDSPDTFSVVDSSEDRPLTGGVGLWCDWRNFNYQDIGEDPFDPSAPLGIAIERIEIRQALP